MMLDVSLELGSFFFKETKRERKKEMKEGREKRKRNNKGKEGYKKIQIEWKLLEKDNLNIYDTIIIFN